MYKLHSQLKTPLISAYLIQIISHVDDVVGDHTRCDFQQIPDQLSMKVDDG